jgi:hypothetical protein
VVVKCKVEEAIATVIWLYREQISSQDEIKDLTSSWVSHLPPEVKYRRMVILGINEVEL